MYKFIQNIYEMQKDDNKISQSLNQGIIIASKQIVSFMLFNSLSMKPYLSTWFSVYGLICPFTKHMANWTNVNKIDLYYQVKFFNKTIACDVRITNFYRHEFILFCNWCTPGHSNSQTKAKSRGQVYITTSASSKKHLKKRFISKPWSNIFLS